MGFYLSLSCFSCLNEVFVISAIAFMVSVTGTGNSHMRFSEADVLLETLSLPPTHTNTHILTQKECQSPMKKDSISLPVLNLTFELNAS